MKKSILALVLLIVVCLANANAQTASQPSAVPGVSSARSLMQQGLYAEALELLRDLTKEHPGDRNIAFLRGFAALEGSRLLPAPKENEKRALLDEAIATLRAILIDEPGLVRVRLELARAFFYKQEDGLARAHFERVLAGNPPLAVVANVRRFLWQIRGRRRWSVHVGFALAPDTNIGGTSDERIIYIFGLPFRRDAEELTKSGVGLSVWGGGEYQHPLGERVRLRLGLDATRREYSGGEFDKMLLSGHVGPRVFATRSTEFSVLGNWRHQWTANEADYFDVGARLQGRHRLTTRITLNGRASWHERRYRTNKHLDGPVRSFSLGGVWVVAPTVRLDLTVGYGRDRPQLLRFRNDNKSLQTGVSFALPLGFTVGGSAGYRWTEFDSSWPPFTPSGVSRKDETWNLKASVLNRAFTAFGFSPQLSVVREVRTSNAQGSDYRRTSGELRFVRQF